MRRRRGSFTSPSRLSLSLNPDDLVGVGPVRLRPVGGEPVGLGDAFARVSSFVGLHSCEGCKKRRHRLNRLKVWGWWRTKERVMPKREVRIPWKDVDPDFLPNLGLRERDIARARARRGRTWDVRAMVIGLTFWAALLTGGGLGAYYLVRLL